jgi:DNA-binding NarL/FixJ family response regulator
MTIRILLADDHEIVRQGLVHILQSQTDFEVVGQAANGRQAVDLAVQLRPDVIIMDVSMPDLNGIDATHQIRKEFPEARVIVLSMHHKRQFVLDMLREGAKGYILKSDISEQLIQGIQAVMAGGVYLSPQIAGSVVDNAISPRTDSALGREPSSTLSAREREILQMIAEGNSTKTIGSRLHISVKTVESTRRRIGIKLGVTSVAELTKAAIAEGLTAVDG